MKTKNLCVSISGAQMKRNANSTVQIDSSLLNGSNNPVKYKYKDKNAMCIRRMC